MKDDKVEEIIDGIAGLPTLPAILVKLNDLMKDPNVSAKEVGQLISYDPAITAKILRIVNSSFYGFPNRITTITHAIVILGFNTIRNIVFSSFVFDAFKGDGETAYDRREFWKHSIACGSAAKVIAGRIGERLLEEYFVRGLLHDIGKIILDQYLHETFVEILTLVHDKQMLIRDAEIEILGVDHSDLGFKLLERWGLSAGLSESILYHHRPAEAEQEKRKAASVIHVADILSRAMLVGSGGDSRIPVVDDIAWAELDLPTSEFASLMRETEGEIEKAKVFMDLVEAS